MKDKIFIFVIGVLFGAVISTGAFYMYSNVANKCISNNTNMQMNNGQPPEKPDGERPEMNGEEPPEKPSDNGSGNANEKDDN